MSAKARTIDWGRVELLYRDGVMLVRQIAAECGVSHTAINKRAADEGWSRDLKAKIKAKADAKVSRAMVSTEVSTETKATEALMVEVEATVQAPIRLTHRTDIGAYRTLARKMVGELQQHSDQADKRFAIEEALAEEEVAEGSELAPMVRKGRLQRLERALSPGSGVKTIKEATDTLKGPVALEREAYSIEGAKPDADAPSQLTDDELDKRLEESRGRSR